MRIGLGCTMLEDSVSHGQIDGVGFYTKCLLEQFQHAQQNITPFSFPPMKQWRVSSSLPNGKFFKLPYLAATSLSLATPRIIPTYRYMEESIDIFHATDHLVPRLKKTRVVATLHDALILKHPEWYASRFRSLKNWIRKQSLQWADHVITISQSMVNEMVEFWGIKEDKISVVYNGLDKDWFEKIPVTQQKTVLAKHGIPENFLLVVGTLQPKKNIPRVIDAFLQLPKDIREQFPLVIVGKAGWNTQESLSAIARLVESKTGYWLRYVPQADLHALFQAAKLYLHVSLHEGFGLTLLQAFASQTPVLTSNVTAMPETAGNAAYLVDPQSTDEISSSIKKLLTNNNLCNDLIAKGQVRAREFSWEKCAAQTLAVYRSLV